LHRVLLSRNKSERDRAIGFRVPGVADSRSGVCAFHLSAGSIAFALARVQFRDLNAPVFLVRVAFPAGPAALNLITDAKAPLPATEPEGWSELAVKPLENDVLLCKRQWGAFYGTELDLQLRRRHVDTVVIGGIATNFGVESTARNGYELGYQLVFAEDAMTSFSKTNHDFATQNIFPRLGRVRTTFEILKALRESN
jgi:nicotinamidase-related amidase